MLSDRHVDEWTEKYAVLHYAIPFCWFQNDFLHHRSIYPVVVKALTRMHVQENQ